VLGGGVVPRLQGCEHVKIALASEGAVLGQALHRGVLILESLMS
jgi:hypothetical protein